MALEAIREVKKVENIAEEMIKDANLKSKEIIGNAEKEALEKYNEVIEKAKNECEKIINEAIIEGNKNVAPILAEGESSAKEILNVSNDKKVDAAKLVIERIVKTNGNS